MRREDTADVLTAVKLAWPHSNLGEPKGALATWHGLLGDFDLADVMAAVHELAATGREQAPPPGVVVRKIAERAVDAPGWDVAWREIEAKARECVTPRGYRIPKAGEFSHPHIGRFARAHWRDLCPPPHQADMGTFRAQMRDLYYGATGELERDAALASVGASRHRALPRPFGEIAGELAVAAPDDATGGPS